MDAETASWLDEMAQMIQQSDARAASREAVKTLVEVEEDKFNPYHDEQGRFTSEGGAGFISLWGKPSEGTAGPTGGHGEDFSSERMAAKREAMMAEGSRLREGLQSRYNTAQHTYDQAGQEYQDAAASQRYAHERADAEFERLDRMRYDTRVPPGELAKQQAEFDRAEGIRKEVDAHMRDVVHSFGEADQTYKAEYKAYTDGMTGISDQLRAKYLDAPEGPGNVAIQPSTFHGEDEPGRLYLRYVDEPMKTGDVPPSWDKGVDVVNNLVGKGMYLPPVQIGVMHPDDDLYASGRSYHSDVGGITMHPNDTRTSTVVHEMGHFIEANVPGATEAIWDHIDSRTAGESWKKLSDITGDRGYRSNETAKPDSFYSPYMGKNYNRSASEFLSMSLQAMYEDPEGFARKDPQSFDFANQLLAQARNFGSVPSQAMLRAIQAGKTIEKAAEAAKMVQK
jgi:hypothetical protein